jgi:hypothetical protein
MRMQRGMPGGEADRPQTGGTTGISASAATGNAADRQPSGTGGDDNLRMQPVQCCCAHGHVNSDAICHCFEGCKSEKLRTPQGTVGPLSSDIELDNICFLRLHPFVQLQNHSEHNASAMPRSNGTVAAILRARSHPSHVRSASGGYQVRRRASDQPANRTALSVTHNRLANHVSASYASGGTLAERQSGRT